MTTYSLGINTCFAVKRWPRPVDWAPIVVDHLGLDLVQHSFDLVDLDDGSGDRVAQAAALAEACSARGLRLHSTFTGLAAYSSNLLLHPDESQRRQAELWYRRAIDFTALAGAAATGGHVGAYSVADWNDPIRRAALGRELVCALRRLARHAAQLGVRSLYVENLASHREPSTMADIGALTREGDTEHAAIELCLDVGHQCVPGTKGAERDPYAWLARFGATAGVVQIQQSTADADHHWPFTATTNAVGRIDADRVLDDLESTGAAKVALLLEVIPPFEAEDGEVLEDLVASVTYWKDAIARRHPR